MNCTCPRCTERRESLCETVNLAFLIAVTSLLVLWLLGVL